MKKKNIKKTANMPDQKKNKKYKNTKKKKSKKKNVRKKLKTPKINQKKGGGEYR